MDDQSAAPHAPRVAFTGSRILDAAGGRYLDECVVLVEDDRILDVARSVPQDFVPVDLGDRTIAPGLIDGHTHVYLHGNLLRTDFERQILKEYPSYRTAHAVQALQTTLAAGFTTIRDLETEGAGYGDVGLRDALVQGVIRGPRMLTAGPALSSTGSYPIARFRPDWRYPVGVDVVDGPDACRRIVREQVSYGVDWIKVYANAGAGVALRSDGLIDGPPNWTAEELGAIVDEAHRLSRPVAAHATSVQGVEAAIAAGVDSIEHGYSVSPASAREMAARGIFFSPTIVATKYCALPRSAERGRVWADALDAQAISVRNAADAGVRIVFGTDVGCFPWTEIAQATEFQNLVDLGISPADAVRTATTAAAAALGLGGEIGIIAPGAYADLIAVSSDPLADPGALTAVDVVVQRGRVVAGQHLVEPTGTPAGA